MNIHWQHLYEKKITKRKHQQLKKNLKKETKVNNKVKNKNFYLLVQEETEYSWIFFLLITRFTVFYCFFNNKQKRSQKKEHIRANIWKIQLNK